MSLRFARVFPVSAALVLLAAPLVGSTVVGCGRGGLGEFDLVDGGAIEDSDPDANLDTDGDDTDIPFDTGFIDEDTGIFADTAFGDTGFPTDTGRPDTGRPDTGRPDTGRPDTGRDTGVVDTFFPTDTFFPNDTLFPNDTAVFDTAFDTGSFDTGSFDTGFDTGSDTGPTDGGILCGPGGSCDPTSEECCVSFSGISCVNKGACGGGTTLSCSSAASCPQAGQTCCFGGFGGGGTPSATCEFFCIGVRLCATNAECPSFQTCQNVFGGYRVCR